MRFTMRYMLLTAVLLAASTDFAAAARDRITPAPSASISPTESLAPSTRPSTSPSGVPTEVLSSSPSSSPPTMAPSISFAPTTDPPSLSPTTSVPSVSPTLNPTRVPTVSPTLNPTSSPTISMPPTSAPSSQPTAVASLQFQTIITFFLESPTLTRRRLQEQLDLAELELLLTAFFTNALQRHGNFKNSFKSVELATDPTFDAETGQVVADVTGNAMYRGADIPTEEELDEILLTYFSFFGTEDLDTFLKGSYPEMMVSGLALEIAGTRLGSSDRDTGNQNTKGDDDPNVGLIVGVVVGGLAVLVLAGVSLRYRNKMSAPPLDRGLVLDNDEDTEAKPGGTPPRIGVSPRRMFDNPQPREIDPPPMAPPSDMMSSEQDARSLSGMISLEESLFTTDNESYSRPTSFQYDASRLDQVISSAKGFAQGLDGDDEVL